MGLVDAWARGTSWSDLIANTSLDEGDVVRIMRRTVDLLAQVPYCEAISEQLRSHARQALKAINRFPVAEAEDAGAGFRVRSTRQRNGLPELLRQSGDGHGAGIHLLIKVSLR